jgi:hypothetical protein
VKVSKAEYEKWMLYGIGYGELESNEVKYKDYSKEYIREDKNFYKKEYVKKEEVIKISAVEGDELKGKKNIEGTLGTTERVVREYDEATGTYIEKVIREVIEDPQDNKYFDTKKDNKTPQEVNNHIIQPKDNYILSDKRQNNKTLNKDIKNKVITKEVNEEAKHIKENEVNIKEEHSEVKEDVVEVEPIKEPIKSIEIKVKGKDSSPGKVEADKKEATKKSESNKKKVLIKIKGKIQKKKVQYKNKAKQDYIDLHRIDLQEEQKVEKELQESNNVSEQDNSESSDKESEIRRSYLEKIELESKDQDPLQTNTEEKPLENTGEHKLLGIEDVKQQAEKDMKVFDSEGNLIEKPTTNEEVAERVTEGRMKEVNKDIKEEIVEEDKEKPEQLVVEFKDDTEEERSIGCSDSRLTSRVNFKEHDKPQEGNFSFKNKFANFSKKEHDTNKEFKFKQNRRNMVKKSSKRLFKGKLFDDDMKEEQKFLDDLYKKVVEEAQQVEEEKERLEEEARRQIEEEARKLEEMKGEEKKEEGLTEEELREQENAKKLEMLLERIGKNHDLRNFILQLTEEELNRISDIVSIMGNFFSGEAYPEFHKSKLKDSKFTPFLDLSELNLKRMMQANVDSKSGMQVGSEADWKIFRVLYNKMKLLGQNNTLSDGVIQNKSLNQEYGLDNFHSLEEIVTSDIDLLKNCGDQSMDIEKKLELLKEQLWAVKSLIERRKKKELDTNIARGIVNEVMTGRTKLSLPKTEKKYKVNVSLVNRRNDMHEIEILERRYQIINS